MRLIGTLTSLALLVSAAPVHASPASKSAAAAAYADGQKRYGAKDYLGAAARFEAAYELDPDPVYLFNAAQAFRFGKSCAAAAELYKKFLAAAPGAPNRVKVTKYIDEMTTCAAADAPAATPPPEPRRPPPVIETSPSSAPAVAPTTQPAQPRDEGDPSAWRGPLRWIGVGTGAVGLVGIGIGVFEHAKVRSAARDREALVELKKQSSMPWTTEDQAAADRLDHKGKRASQIAIASYALGGAAVAAGITMYILGSRSHAAEHVALTPTADGAVLSSAFSF